MNALSVPWIIDVHLAEDFGRDVADVRLVSYREWRRRPLRERGHEWLGALRERQQ